MCLCVFILSRIIHVPENEELALFYGFHFCVLGVITASLCLGYMIDRTLQSHSSAAGAS